MDSQIPPLPPAKKTNWWLLGGGGCLCLIVVGVIGYGTLYFGFSAISKWMKSSESYQMAVTTATNSPEVQAELGTPIQPGMMVQGDINSSASAESANLSFLLKGPKASATVHFAGRKTDGKWDIRDFTVTVWGSGKTITLKPAH